MLSFLQSLNAEEKSIDEAGFVEMFNGKDLTGWIPINVDASTFRWEDGMVKSTGLPTGLLRTEKHYENFIIELEWRHLKSGGNAGLFLYSDPVTKVGVPFARGIEVQILDNGYNAKGKNEWYSTHGDIFDVHGAKMTPAGKISPNGIRSFPMEERCKSSPEWNHYRVEARNGEVWLSVNGKQVTYAKDCKPRKGYLCLESEGSECHFRNVRIKELPSTNPTAEETANLDEGFKLLYNGINLDGFKVDEGQVGHWKPKDWVLSYDGKGTGKDPSLWTIKEYKDVEIICDWRWVDKPVKTKHLVILPNGENKLDEAGNPVYEEVDDAGDSGIYLRGNIWSQVNIWCWPVGSGEVYGYRTNKKYSPEVRAGVTPKENADKPIGQWNRFHIKMIGDRLSVNLNGKQVIEQAQLPGVPEQGPIGLQHHGHGIQFANIYVKEIN
jgi:hypothetical protein